MKGHTFRGAGVLVILLVIGGIIGSWLGIVLEKLWPDIGILNQTQVVGLPPTTLDLQVFSLTLGFVLRLNLLTVGGFLLAYLVYRKL